jgi:hypothetical protein
MDGVKPLPETVQELSRAPAVDSGSLIENDAADAGIAKTATVSIAEATESFLIMFILQWFWGKSGCKCQRF